MFYDANKVKYIVTPVNCNLNKKFKYTVNVWVESNNSEGLHMGLGL